MIKGEASEDSQVGPSATRSYSAEEDGSSGDELMQDVIDNSSSSSIIVVIIQEDEDDDEDDSCTICSRESSQCVCLIGDTL